MRKKERRMDARTRRTLEMAIRALNFSRAHPDPSSGSIAALSRLESAVARAEQLVIQQRDGFSEVRAASTQKRELRRKIRRTHLLHLSRVAEAAGPERPELEQKFVLAPEATPYLAFRAAARGIANEAQNEKELLVNYGLLEPVLESLNQALDHFDRAVERGTVGRRAHVGARAELRAISDEIIQVVRLMDGTNRYRFANDPESLAAWQSTSNTFGPTRTAVSRGGQAGGRSDAKAVETAAADKAAVEPVLSAAQDTAATTKGAADNAA
jgi:hypothetical protein